MKRAVELRLSKYSSSTYDSLNQQDLYALAGLYSSRLIDEESLIGLFKNHAFTPAIDQHALQFISATVMSSAVHDAVGGVVVSGPLSRAVVMWLNRVLLSRVIDWKGVTDEDGMRSLITSMIDR